MAPMTLYDPVTVAKAKAHPHPRAPQIMERQDLVRHPAGAPGARGRIELGSFGFPEVIVF